MFGWLYVWLGGDFFLNKNGCQNNTIQDYQYDDWYDAENEMFEEDELDFFGDF